MTLPYPPGRRWGPSQCRGCPIWSHPPLAPSFETIAQYLQVQSFALPTPTAAAAAVDDVVDIVAAMDGADAGTVAVVIAAASAAAAVITLTFWCLFAAMARLPCCFCFCCCDDSMGIAHAVAAVVAAFGS